MRTIVYVLYITRSHNDQELFTNSRLWPACCATKPHLSVELLHSTGLHHAISPKFGQSVLGSDEGEGAADDDMVGAGVAPWADSAFPAAVARLPPIDTLMPLLSQSEFIPYAVTLVCEPQSAAYLSVVLVLDWNRNHILTYYNQATRRTWRYVQPSWRL